MTRLQFTGERFRIGGAAKSYIFNSFFGHFDKRVDRTAAACNRGNLPLPILRRNFFNCYMIVAAGAARVLWGLWRALLLGRFSLSIYQGLLDGLIDCGRTTLINFRTFVVTWSKRKKLIEILPNLIVQNISPIKQICLANVKM